MAEIRCPNCGRNNPDVLDVCQFCQAPLKPDSVLRIGDTPARKIRVNWNSFSPSGSRMFVSRQGTSRRKKLNKQLPNQSPAKRSLSIFWRDSASQAGSSDEEEVPDWLARINPAKPKPEAPSAPTPQPETDFFAQIQAKRINSTWQEYEPVQEDIPPGQRMQRPNHPPLRTRMNCPNGSHKPPNNRKSLLNLILKQDRIRVGGAPLIHPYPAQGNQAPKEEEDLSWLRNLEEVSKQTGDLKAPKQGMRLDGEF